MEILQINIACNLRFTNPFILISHGIHRKEGNGEWEDLLPLIWNVLIFYFVE